MKRQSLVTSWNDVFIFLQKHPHMLNANAAVRVPKGTEPSEDVILEIKEMTFVDGDLAEDYDMILGEGDIIAIAEEVEGNF